MKAHELLATPDRWTQKEFARDSKGRPASFRSQEACCFCVLGAFNRCYSDHAERDSVYWKLKKRIGQYISSWNDAPERTHAEVLAVLKELDI